MNKTLLKRILAYAGIVLFFLILSYSFVPQVLSGKVVNQSDISSWSGMTHEVREHNKANPDDKTFWTNSMFGGMPTAAMYDDFEGDWTKPLYKLLLLGKRPASYLFVALLGAFLLMLSLGIDKWLSVGGAIAIAFCSYNMQIIQVGHNTKMQAIAFFPWVLAALIFTYRKALNGEEGKGKIPSWLTGSILGSVFFALAICMQVKANHPQITWYLAGVIVIYAIALLIHICTDKARRRLLKRFFAASALLFVVGCCGIATNANKLLPTWNYSKHTMRGGSELTTAGGEERSSGLDIAYATAWSYGIEETPNLLIPNFNGGSSSGSLKQASETGKLLKSAGYRGRELSETLRYLPLYWGPQPFTAGPMYLGAISIFLFLLGLFLCEGKDKWWILAATVIAVLLSWGNHFLWFTKLFFKIAPMYNKFRTVSMALTVLQVTVPVLGFVCLDKVLKGNGTDRKELFKYGAIAWGLTAGFCLLCSLFPGIAGSFTGSSDAGIPEALARALAEDRARLLSSDALRSAVLITAAFALILWAYAAQKKPDNGFAFAGRCAIVGGCICLLVLIDLFPVGKRYLDKDDFITQNEFSGQFEKRPADKYILEDTDPDYRVLDLSVNTFNDAHQCYWHKCIGGYSPAKMQRYQDLIDRYISKEIGTLTATANKEKTIQGVEENFPDTPVLNALNCRYVILQGDLPPVMNPNVLGNAWFVEEAVSAGSADEEIALLETTDLRREAVIRGDIPQFEKPSETPFESDLLNNALDDIVLTSYAANELHYSYCCSCDRLAVFSEIYYPNGWKATCNGQPLELLRADWVLRCAVLPAGEGEIVMRFEPQSYKTGAAISRASSITLLLLLLLAVSGGYIRRIRK